MTDLDPCKFCGGKAFLTFTVQQTHHVECIDCHARTAPHELCDVSAMAAISAWNRKPIDKQD